MIEIGAKIAKKNDWKKSKNLSVHRVKIAILPILICLILLRCFGQRIERREGGAIFYQEFEGIKEPIYKFYCNIKSLAFTPSYR